MKNYVFDVYIDISGKPKSTQFFGLIAINAEFSYNFEKLFSTEFPGLLKGKVKGKDLKPNKLIQIMSFFDKNKAYFSSQFIPSTEWEKHKSDFSGAAYFNERIYGVAYYRLLEQVAKRKSSIRYNAVLCEDNQLGTKKARNYLRRLLSASNRSVRVSSGLPRDVPQLKFADFVASAHRRAGYQELKKFSHYKRCPPPLPPRLLHRVFESRDSKKK